jgi:hypothetical protein
MELAALFPPPTCTVPIEFDAVLFPLPATAAGAETPAFPTGVLLLADTFTDVLPI